MTKLNTFPASWIDSTVLEYEREQQEQDRRPLTEKADPLALSWASYAVWKRDPLKRWVNWSDLMVLEHDRVMADETRRYYRNRLAMRALKQDQEPTQFQRDLYDICNGGIMKGCHRGMLYRLPYLYAEDIAREELANSTQAQPDLKHLPSWLLEKQTRSLTRHGRIFRSRRSGEFMEYWFHDDETGYAVLWNVEYKNPLRTVIEGWYESSMPARVHAHWHVGWDRFQPFQYCHLSQAELRFE